MEALIANVGAGRKFSVVAHMDRVLTLADGNRGYLKEGVCHQFSFS